MADTKSNFEIDSYEDILSSAAERTKADAIVELKIDLIDDFKDHPFKIIDDENMQALAKSISELGQLEPAKVRVKEDGRYEMISGHRRKHAIDKYLHGETILCRIMDVSYDEAVIMMVESNIQRATITISEKAFAVKMRKEAIERMKAAYISENTIGRGHKMPEYIKGKSCNLASREFGICPSQATRLIHLTYLPREILDKVDAKVITQSDALRIASTYRESDDACKEALNEEIGRGKTVPTQKAIEQLEQYCDNDMLTPEIIQEVLHPEKPEEKNSTESFSLKGTNVKKHIPAELLLKESRKKLEQYLIAALELYGKLENAETFEEFSDVARAIFNVDTPHG